MKFVRYVIVFLIIILIVCGFSLKDKQKSFILFSEQPIGDNAYTGWHDVFAKGTPIYYTIFVPKGFKDDLIRLQVLKKETKVGIGGYTVKYVQDREVVKGSSAYADKLVLFEAGTYLMQAVEFTHPSKAVAFGVFQIE